ncbi:MAG TPA: wax ester/triacylglycerol synthase family O-acyltransferase [Solirubrobacteraceae bacterium]|nr:wax ester/triacylglycerol synthase family O-acyltransferase [Solirubrobacteraceae bacterium]
MSEHLTPLDATFLELEEADDSAHMHIGAIMVFDPTPDGRIPTRLEIGAHLAHRLGQLPRYGQRLSVPHTGGLTWPAWEEDPEFDLKRHLAHAALPAPGGQRELAEWSSEFFSQRLDRHRPLWEMALVEGLEGGRWALATKTHHCMVDGVGSVDVGHLLLDLDPEGPPEDPEARTELPTAHGSTGPQAGPLALVARAWKELEGFAPAAAGVKMAHMGAHGALHPREALSNTRAAVEMIIRDELRAAPHTSLNEPIGTRRRFDVVQVPLDDMKTIKNALGGTINDVALTVSASGLRALLASRGEALPEEGIRVMVPMNVRLAGEKLALGNKVSSLFIDLPLAHPSVVDRYHETVARSQATKSDPTRAAGATAVIEVAGLAPPMIHSAVAQSLYANRLFNVTVTNVPGPQQTLYALGAPLREIHPLVPLAAAHAVGVAIVSYDGNAFFGVVADRDIVADLDVMLDAMSSSVQELLAAAHPTHATRPHKSSDEGRSPRTRRASAARRTG